MPLGLDDRWPDDTLFMVFEEDFRFDNNSGTVESTAAQLDARGSAEEAPQPRAGRSRPPPAGGTDSSDARLLKVALYAHVAFCDELECRTI